jgi:hypothetical protein
MLSRAALLPQPADRQSSKSQLHIRILLVVYRKLKHLATASSKVARSSRCSSKSNLLEQAQLTICLRRVNCLRACDCMGGTRTIVARRLRVNHPSDNREQSNQNIKRSQCEQQDDCQPTENRTETARQLV